MKSSSVVLSFEIYLKMTSHNNIKWPVVGEANKHEFDSTAKWFHQYLPQSPINQRVFSKLHLPEAKYEAQPNCTLEKVFRKHLHETEVLAPSPQQQLLLSSPTPAASSLLQKNMDSKRGKEEYMSPLHVHDPSSVATTTSTKKHCRRKHRQNCPKHLLNEQKREQYATRCCTTVEDKDALEETTLSKKKQQRGRIFFNQPNVPDMIGKGLATLLTGVCLPQVLQRRNDYLDFRVENEKVDEQKKKVNDGLFVREKLVQDTLQRKHFRKKDEIKSHMEHMRGVGKALLRPY